jgi:hypothetical protein
MSAIFGSKRFNPFTRVPQLAPGDSFSHELFDHQGRLEWIFVLPDSDREPACRGELDFGVAVAASDAAELQAPPTGVGLGQMAVLRTRVPIAPVDEHRDPRAAQQDVNTPTAVATRHRSIDDEPQTAAV